MAFAFVDGVATATSAFDWLPVDTDVAACWVVAFGRAAAAEFVLTVTARVNDATLPAALLVASTARRVLPMEVGAGAPVAILAAAAADLTEPMPWL